MKNVIGSMAHPKANITDVFMAIHSDPANASLCNPIQPKCRAAYRVLPVSPACAVRPRT